LFDVNTLNIVVTHNYNDKLTEQELLSGLQYYLYNSNGQTAIKYQDEFNPTFNLGCELLAEQINIVKPKIHVCGHIHTGYGYKFDGNTHYFNAAVLNEQYNFTQKPITIEWNPETNEIEFLD